MRGERLIVYPDGAGRYRWKKLAGNNRTISTSGQSFSGKYEAGRAAQDANPGVPIAESRAYRTAS